MKTKIACISDFHYSWALKDQKLAGLRQVMAEDWDILVFNGDLLHAAKWGVDYGQQASMLRELSEVLAGPRPVIVVEGNHDQMGNFGSALDILQLPNLLLIRDRVQVLRFANCECAFIPWIRKNPNWHEDTLAVLNSFSGLPPMRILFGHLNIANAEMHRHGPRSRVNPDDHMVFEAWELESSGFEPARCLYGHLHMAQKVGTWSQYIGTFMESNFGEEGFGARWALVVADDEMGVSVEHRSLHAPHRFITLRGDEELIEPQHFYRVYTDDPDKWASYPNVKQILPKPEAMSTKNDVAYGNQMNMQKLLEDFCEKRGLRLDSEWKKSEAAKLCLDISRDQTGIDCVERLAATKLGPNQKTLIHQEFDLEFKQGLIAVVGGNGKGKTLAIETILAGLYGRYPTRGTLESMLHGRLRLQAQVQGQQVVVEHEKTRKGDLRSLVNDSESRTRGGFASDIKPLFGDAEVFRSVCFMDQDSRYDLVGATDAKRVEILQGLLNLGVFEAKREEYVKLLKDVEEFERTNQEVARRLQEALAVCEDLKTRLASAPPLDKERLPRAKANAALWAKHSEYQGHLRRLASEREYLANIPERTPEGYKQAKQHLERIAVVEAELKRHSPNPKGIGCAAEPLPCVFLKAKISEAEVEELRRELRGLEKLRKGALQAVFDYEKRLGCVQTIARIEASLPTESLELEGLTEEGIRLELEAARLVEAIHSELLVQQHQNQDLLNRLFAEFKEPLPYTACDVEELIEVCHKNGFPLFIISSITEELQGILDNLCDIADIGLYLRIQLTGKNKGDTFKIEYSRHGRPWAPVLYGSSNGERSFIRFIFKLGLMLYLNSYFGNYRVLIMDEPENGLESANIEALTRVLAKMKERLNQIIVITHNNYIVQIADQVIEFR